MRQYAVYLIHDKPGNQLMALFCQRQGELDFTAARNRAHASLKAIQEANPHTAGAIICYDATIEPPSRFPGFTH